MLEISPIGFTSAATTRTPKNSRNSGFRILPTQVRILPGNREKPRTIRKNTPEKMAERRPRCDTGAQQRRHADGKRHRRAARDGEEGPNGQIQRAGEEDAIAPADLAGKLDQPIAAADAHGSHAHQRQTDAGDQKANGRLPHMAPCHLPHVDGKDQIPRAEEQAKQHTRNKDQLFFA